ncbi:Maf family protein [Bacillota bacterium LX-D]|nr:Maf family protein [Bacillota bacterium LX-D]
MTNIVLASSSPRRKELLEVLGLNFQISTSAVDESIGEGLSPSQAVECLALKKAQAVAPKYPRSLIIGADTVVALDNLLLGKPKDDDDALAMLLKLQNRRHQVYSGVALVNTSTGEYSKAHEVTNVEFRPIGKEEALRYIKTREPEGKAGAYAIQGYGSIFVKRIEGDYFNVVGLPLFLLSRLFKNYGVEVF